MFSIILPLNDIFPEKKKKNLHPSSKKGINFIDFLLRLKTFGTVLKIVSLIQLMAEINILTEFR